MKTLMVCGVREEWHPFNSALRGMPYEIIKGTEQPGAPLRPSETRLFMESGNAEEVLKNAREYGVNGILGVGEPASLAASYATQQLGLPGMPYAEEQLFHNLFLLRAFQDQQHFQTPRYQDLTHSLYTGELAYPLYVGPADGHVLRHTVRVDSPEELAAARQQAMHHSPGGWVIAQEDLAAQSGQEVLYVMTELIVRDEVLQPILWCEVIPGPDGQDYIPAGARYPARMSKNHRMVLTGECTRLVRLLRLRNAQIPVLACCVPGVAPYLLRIGVRDGAYIMTRFLSHLYRHDLLRDALRLAAGDRLRFYRYREPAEGTWRAYYTIRSYRAGILRHIRFDKEIRKYRKGFLRRARQSDQIYGSSGHGQEIGTMMLEFREEAEMDEILARVESLVHVQIDPFDGLW